MVTKGHTFAGSLQPAPLFEVAGENILVQVTDPPHPRAAGHRSAGLAKLAAWNPTALALISAHLNFSSPAG